MDKEIDEHMNEDAYLYVYIYIYVHARSDTHICIYIYIHRSETPCRYLSLLALSQQALKPICFMERAESIVGGMVLVVTGLVPTTAM